jgi:hypothetical protein
MIGRGGAGVHHHAGAGTKASPEAAMMHRCVSWLSEKQFMS